MWIFYNCSVKALWRSLRRIFYTCLGQTRKILTSSFALMRRNCALTWSQIRMTMNLKTGMNYDDVLKHKHLIWFLLLLYSMPITEMIYHNVSSRHLILCHSPQGLPLICFHMFLPMFVFRLHASIKEGICCGLTQPQHLPASVNSIV